MGWVVSMELSRVEIWRPGGRGTIESAAVGMYEVGSIVTSGPGGSS